MARRSGAMSRPSSTSAVPQQPLVIHTQIALCNYTLPSHSSANTQSANRQSSQVAPSAINTPVAVTFHHPDTPPAKQQRITSISQQQIHNHQVCCGHQFTDRCSERESRTRPRSSPLRLDTQASRRAPALSTHMYIAQHQIITYISCSN